MYVSSSFFFLWKNNYVNEQVQMDMNFTQNWIVRNQIEKCAEWRERKTLIKMEFTDYFSNEVTIFVLGIFSENIFLVKLSAVDSLGPRWNEK